MIRALLASTALLASLGSAAAQDPQGFVQTLVTDMSASAEDEAALQDLLEEALATDAIGRFLFAGAPSELASAEQEAEYQALFPAYIAASFSDQIGDLARREIVLGTAIQRGGDETIVQSRLVDSEGRDRAKIDWRVRTVEGEPRLLDVMVERVSPLVARRQEFSAIAQRDGVDALIAHMRSVVEAKG